MSKKKPQEEATITMEEFLNECFVEILKERPKGSFTVNEIVAKTGRRHSRVQAVLSEKVNSGELQWAYTIERGKRVRVFWVTKKKAK